MKITLRTRAEDELACAWLVGGRLQAKDGVCVEDWTVYCSCSLEEYAGTGVSCAQLKDLNGSLGARYIRIFR